MCKILPGILELMCPSVCRDGEANHLAFCFSGSFILTFLLVHRSQAFRSWDHTGFSTFLRDGLRTRPGVEGVAGEGWGEPGRGYIFWKIQSRPEEQLILNTLGGGREKGLVQLKAADGAL